MPALYIPAILMPIFSLVIAFIFQTQRKKLDVTKPDEALRSKQLLLVMKLVVVLNCTIAALLAFFLQPMLGQTI